MAMVKTPRRRRFRRRRRVVGRRRRASGTSRVQFLRGGRRGVASSRAEREGRFCLLTRSASRLVEQRALIMRKYYFKCLLSQVALGRRALL